MKSFGEDERGFTLVEVLIALTIFAVGLLGVVGMQITGMRGNTSAHLITATSSVAQSVMEEILSKKGDDPIFTAGTFNWDFDPALVGVNSYERTGMGIYNATYTVTLNDPVAKVARVVVNVTGQNRQASLTGFKRME